MKLWYWIVDDFFTVSHGLSFNFVTVVEQGSATGTSTLIQGERNWKNHHIRIIFAGENYKFGSSQRNIDQNGKNPSHETD